MYLTRHSTTPYGRRIALWASLLLCAVCLARAGVSVCAKCGHENEAAGKRCSHCQAALPGSADVAGDSRGASRSVSAGEAVSGPWVESEIELARKALSEGDAEVARLLLRNASALEQLSAPAPSSSPGRGERILQLQQRIDGLKGMVREPCAACGGTGQEVLQLQLLNGRASSGSGSSRPCRRCAGKGHTSKRGSVDAVRFARGQAVSRYKALQQSRRYLPVGEAWVPPEFEGSLTVAQTVTLKRVAASSCADCSGLGKVGCAECGDRGRIKCSNRKCQNGIVISEREEHFGKGSHTWRSKCAECEGRGWVSCGACGGNGCRLCEACSGSGERPLCKRCTGRGMQPCRRCSGKGDRKGSVCTACEGEGLAACATCNGDGRSR